MNDRDRYRKEYTTLGIALAGVYASAPNQWSDHAASISIPDNRLTPYLGDLAEGGVVVDKRSVPIARLVELSVSGPMLKESLPAGTKDVFSFDERKPVPVVEGEKLGGFDYIALDVYLNIWRKAGARIGKRVADAIHWEDGEVYPIPPEAERWQATAADDWAKPYLRRDGS